MPLPDLVSRPCRRLRPVAPSVLAIAVALTAHTAAGDDPARGSVSGSLTTVSGEPVPGVDVRFEPPAPARTRTSQDGTFLVSGLLPGPYRVRIELPGYASVAETVTVEAGGTARLALRLLPALTAVDATQVTASYTIGREEPGPGIALSRSEMLHLPHFGDDAVRALPFLPGVAANDTSAQFSVRGGLPRDTRFLLDGVEIVEPYHLKDYQGVFSIVDPRHLADLQLLPGGCTSEYGSGLAGVLDMTTVTPTGPSRAEVGISLTGVWAGGSGTFAGGRGDWFASIRRGYLDQVLKLVGSEDETEETRDGPGPRYWDAHGKVSYELKPGHRTSVQYLTSDDRLESQEHEMEDGFPEHHLFDTSYGSSFAWLRDDALVSESAFVSTTASAGRVRRDRIARGSGYGFDVEIRDARRLDILGLRQDWSLQPSTAHLLKWGFDLRRLRADYDYRNGAGDGLGAPRAAFAGRLSGTEYAAYVSERFRIGDRLTAEGGVRWDGQSLTDEAHLSPRLAIVHAGPHDLTLRASWGIYFQSQRPNELQVEDGETRVWGAERAEHRIFGLEKGFTTSRGRYRLRLDAYERLLSDLRPRWENVLDPRTLYPETSSDRILFAPSSARARGLELLLSRHGDGALDWRLGYTWARVTDRIDGRDVPRSADQTHAATLDVSWRPSSRWTLSAVWVFHSGWPTTEVHGLVVPGPDGSVRIEPVLGELNGERLPAYHRLDLRVSRSFPTRRLGTVELFVDVQNVYDRDNLSGYQVDDRRFRLDETGRVIYTPKERYWLGIVPSFGVAWRF